MNRTSDDSAVICIIGAGMAGLTCATALAAAGRQVRLIDKGRGPGGRMATRRAQTSGGPAAFDHGAQYFTARDPGFRKQVASWDDRGVVARWPVAGEDAWVGVPGMNEPLRAMAEPLDAEWGRRALALKPDGDLWRIETEGGAINARTVLIALPAEQAHALLADAAPELAKDAGGVRSDPCWTVMVRSIEPLDLPDIVRGEGRPIAWAARNSAKPGRTGSECWVVQASPQRSRDLIALDRETVGPVLLEEFFEQVGVSPAAPVHLAAHRWLYAKPSVLAGAAARYDAKARIGIAGDYLHSPRVEGAWISGTTLARKVLETAQWQAGLPPQDQPAGGSIGTAVSSPPMSSTTLTMPRPSVLCPRL